ncbi:lipopolysaccharide assembly protein LapA domain-containing protein [Dokdonella soli]
MRLILIILILLVVALGALFGALNGARIPIDFYFFQLAMPTGAALLGALLAGWLLGGLVAWVGQVPRLRRDLRTVHRDLREARTLPSAGTREDA